MAGSQRTSRRNDNATSRRARGNDGGESRSSSRSRRVIIKPLSTIGDRGTPTSSVSKDMQRVINMVQDERHLVAYDLYLNCKERLRDLREKKKDFDAAQSATEKEKTKMSWMPKKKKKSTQPTFDVEEFDAAVELVRKYKDDFLLLEKRAKLFQACRDNMDESEGWTLAQTLFGVTTFYRREEDGSLSIKLEGELQGVPLFEQVAVLREIDLNYLWAPFVSSSLTIAHLDKLDTVGWFMIGLPNFGIARDACFRAIGCDCVEEDQSVLVVGRGVADRDPDKSLDEVSKFLSEGPEIKALDIPPVPTRVGSGRMTINKFEVKIRVMSADHCHTYVLANINPNLSFIPQSLLEFVMKKLCGILLNKLQACAKKITKEPLRNAHAQRMRDEAAFYRDWLVPKFRNVAAEKGWDMPPVAAFNLSQAQQVEAEKINKKRTIKAQSFSQFDSGASSDDHPNSTRSTPNLYHSKPLDSKDDDDDSDISSLSGTSQSLWKNNPIASYLREIETKTQERKDKAVQESRRKAAAMLRPRPLPVDKQERLQELKDHKFRKKASRQISSSGSIDGLSLTPVDENDAGTVVTAVTSRSVPYSPISAALKGQGRWPRLWVVSGLVLLLFILLHGDRFLPSCSSLGDGKFAYFLREFVALVYMILCGVVHFFLCDVQLIYAFEAFELGMKSGEQVKTFYRGKMRLLVAAASGLMVTISIGKAVLIAGLRAAIVLIFGQYQRLIAIYANGDDKMQEEIPADVEEALEENVPLVETDASELNTVVYSSPFTALCYGYFYFMGCIHAVFDWQLRVFVRSNLLGRALESVTTRAYNTWIGAISSIGNSIFSLFRSESGLDGGFSWRDDAISTLRVLLTYTSVLLLVVLFFLNLYAKGYRHKPPRLDSPDKPSVATVSTSGSDQTSLASGSKLPKRVVAPSRSVDSGTKRRLKFLAKRKEKMDDDSD